MTYKVIQWTTGHVGREAVKVIMRHPELELVGCYAWSKDKAGKDVGELCGIDPTGVIATGDIEHLLAMDADCVCYMPTFPDIDEVERILLAGKNVVSSYFINARSWGPEVQGRLIKAAEEGGVSLFGNISGLCQFCRCADGIGELWLHQDTFFGIGGFNTL